MAIPLKLFFGRDYKIDSKKGSVTFDLILSESHNISNEVSEHPVEDGSVISDHIKNNLENGSLTVMVSNFSLNIFTSVLSDRAQDAYDEIVRIWKNRELVTIVSVLKVYDDVAITDVSTARSADTGSAIVMDIGFKKVKIVKLKTVLIDVGVKIKGTTTSIERQASPPTDQGRTIGKTVQ